MAELKRWALEGQAHARWSGAVARRSARDRRFRFRAKSVPSLWSGRPRRNKQTGIPCPSVEQSQDRWMTTKCNLLPCCPSALVLINIAARRWLEGRLRMADTGQRRPPEGTRRQPDRPEVSVLSGLKPRLNFLTKQARRTGKLGRCPFPACGQADCAVSLPRPPRA